MTAPLDTAASSPDLAGRRVRPPATVIAAAALTIVVASVGTYGAVFFTGIDGYDDVDITFVSLYAYVALIGIVSVVLQLRGSAIGRAGAITWALFGVMFTLVKLITIQEMEAIGFGVVSLIVLALEFAPATRRFIREG